VAAFGGAEFGLEGLAGGDLELCLGRELYEPEP